MYRLGLLGLLVLLKIFIYINDITDKHLQIHTRYFLGMAKTVCEDWASLLLNEKVQITVNNEQFQKTLDNILLKNNFRVRGNQIIEMAFALGSGGFVEFQDAKGSTNIDYISAQQIYPITTINGEITECAFASEVSKDDKGSTYYINIHTLDDNGNYIIENKKIKANDDHIEEITDNNLLDTITTNSPIPRFQIIKPNICNNLNYDSGLGISVYANAIDSLKSVDIAFDSYVNELSLGRKRIYIPQSMLQMTMGNDGVTSPAFDVNDMSFYAVSDDSVDKLTETNGELRFEAHEAALQKFLNLLSKKCGLGTDRYEFKQDGVKTATEVISEKSDLYQSRQKHGLILISALQNMVKSIAEIEGIDSAELEVNIQLDDSIIEDNNAISNRSLLELQSGVIDRIEYYKRVYGMTDEAAAKLDKDIKARATPQTKSR